MGACVLLELLIRRAEDIELDKFNNKRARNLDSTYHMRPDL